jgi:ferritin-like metal-binding protein YciE
MSTENMPGQPPVQRVAEETLVANLRNAHALEKQVVAVLKSQLGLLADYPELHARIAQHIVESRQQANRLQTALVACGSSTSMVKDALLSVMGLGQSSVQGLSSDAVLKAIVADMMTEHLEIATYKTLIVLAEMAGRSEICAALEVSLKEEEAMADWFDQNLDQITRRFIELDAEKALQADMEEQERARKREEMASKKRRAEEEAAQAEDEAAEKAGEAHDPPPAVEPATGQTPSTDKAADGASNQPPTDQRSPSVF